MVREIEEGELHQLLELYLHLHEDSVPELNGHITETWRDILADNHHHIIVFESDGRIVSSCVCIIVPNLTRGARPYALIENVVTHQDYRGKGYATACLHFARSIAQQSGCYKIMLLTGAKDDATLHFYRNAGYNSGDKTAFVQWIT